MGSLLSGRGRGAGGPLVCSRRPMEIASVCPDLRHELTLLVLSRYPLVAIETADEVKVANLAQQVASDLSMPLLEWSSTHGLVRRSGGAIQDTRDPAAALEKVLDMRAEILVLLKDIHPYFERPEVLRLLRESEQRFLGRRSSLLLSGVRVDLPSELAPMASRIEIALPTQRELEDLVRRTALELERQRRTQIDLSPDELTSLARALGGLHLQEARRVLYQAALSDSRLAGDDLPAVREGKQRRLRHASHLDWIEPLEGMSVMGGAGALKEWARRRREAFGEAARRFGLEAPKGVLLVGVPGTGKSLACRALAGEWELPLLRLDPGRLYDKYVGETEANLRRGLEASEAMAPAVLWVDEIEKAIASGTGSADDGLSQRVLGTLLTWMQERPAPVFLMATSNDVSRLPMEVLRRGRFDEIFFVDLPGPEDRATIFSIHLEKREWSPESFDLDRLASLSDGFSGAEIESVIVAALYHAFSEQHPLRQEFLEAEIAAARPLSELRPDDVRRLREWGHRHARLA